MHIDLFTSPQINLSGWHFDTDVELRPLEDLMAIDKLSRPAVIVGTAEELSQISPKHIDRIKDRGLRIIITGTRPGVQMPRFPKELVHSTLPELAKREEQRLLLSFINNSLELLLLHEHSRLTKHDLEELTWIGVLLSSQKDTDELLELILSKAREITNCDAGSLYLVEQQDDVRKLRFKMLQNDSIPLELNEFLMPLDEWSLAGYAAITGENLIINNSYDIDPEAPYSHNRWIDKQNNYRTITMLAVPLKNLKDEVVGVLQLINRKRDFNTLLTNPLTALLEVIPFDDRSINLVSSLASQAAVTLEKNMLYESIQDLFKGFVQASVTAIESRDPTTSGHSQRVSELTVALAEEVNKVEEGVLAEFNFSKEKLIEIRYAGLLHDFGKVGVPEDILTKEKKLYPEEAAVIKGRAESISKSLEIEKLKALNALMEKGKAEYEAQKGGIAEKSDKLIERLQDDIEFIWQANVPRILEGDSQQRLKDIAAFDYLPENYVERRLINEKEAETLNIQRGNLNWEEIQQIRKHSTFSHDFLKEIPWTSELKGVPEIAYSHHEFTDRTGYPRKLNYDEISIQARMMTIADIFDALTASDRPYKKAAPCSVALRILGSMAEEGKLDKNLLELFKSTEVYKVVGQALDKPS